MRRIRKPADRKHYYEISPPFFSKLQPTCMVSTKRTCASRTTRCGARWSASTRRILPKPTRCIRSPSVWIDAEFHSAPADASTDGSWKSGIRRFGIADGRGIRGAFGTPTSRGDRRKERRSPRGKVALVVTRIGQGIAEARARRGSHRR